ncbi:putative ulp1 protease family protein [Neofusicoccum parvum UCRNP2]|uniref:Putative ulp1 protease family protein n=1 Tax=Botryosphaeria parva (strain UCR-NP2) TaxID=1287680 RepID=R1EIL2_BOTPV|nr:putative ulp1 protease family protein [Neofusicoccum parvum UCRNP2]
MATASPTAKAVACLDSLYRSSSRKLLSQYATAKAEYKQSFPNGDFDARLGGELRAALDRLAHQSHGNSELDGLQGKIAACWGVSVEQLRTAMDNCASVQFFRNISKFAAATDFDTALRVLTEQRNVRLGARQRGNRRDAGWMPADSERALKALKPAQVPDDDDADEPETARNALSELSDLSDHTYESLFSAADSDSDSDAEPEPPSKKRRTSPAAEEDEGPAHSVVEDEMPDQAPPCYPHELLTVEEKQRVLERLRPLIWLNDLTVNYILDLITAPLKSYQNVNSLCFTPDRPAKPGFIRSETAVLIMPIHVLAAHWVLASYNRELDQVQTLDSISSLPRAARAVEQRVKAFIQQQLGRDRLVYVQRACPQQSNGSDCGVYMLAMALYVISGRLPPQQLDATFWRGALAVLVGSNAPDDEDVPLASRNTQDLPSTMARLFQERTRYTNAMDLHTCLSFLQSNSVNIAEIQASINDVQNEVALLVDLQTVGSKISDQTRSVNMALLAEDISNAQSRESSYDSSAHVKMMENVSKSMEKQNITKLEEELARLHVKTIPC